MAAWSPGPREPLLRAGEVHIWRAELDLVGDDVIELLDPDEREREQRILGEQKRRSWGRSRGVLRALLGRYLCSDPHALRFVTGDHGKPVLVALQGDGRLWSFNLSHSRGLALYAFAADGAVGVDVQFVRAREAQGSSDRVASALHAFGEDEARRLHELGSDERERDFVQLWTRYEAELKRRGVGIGRGEHTPIDRQSASIIELDVGPDAAAAVACAQAPSVLHMWDWPRIAQP
jgi:4'-phosphopantetheinyl transferase